MKVWDATISGHKGTKYHKMILLEDFNKFVKQLKETELDLEMVGLTYEQGDIAWLVMNNFIDKLVNDTVCVEEEP